MARIYGGSGAEKTLLKSCPDDIDGFHDIKTSLKDTKNTLEDKKQSFFNELPERINTEQDTLQQLNEDKTSIDNKWNDDIASVRDSIKERNRLIKTKHQVHLILPNTADYLRVQWIKYHKKPKEMKEITNRINTQSDVIQDLEHNPKAVFENEESYLVDRKNNLETAYRSTDYRGAYGELAILDELKKLDDDYSVFCDLQITLKDYVTYKGQRNLRSAQIDYVVTGPTGIYSIEVKNWGNSFEGKRFSPHEQADREGLCLYIYLKNHFVFYVPKVKNLLVSVKGNMRYDPRHPYVFVTSKWKINNFIKQGKSSIPFSRLDKINRLLEKSIRNKQLRFK
jgi:hypothetical protein